MDSWTSYQCLALPVTVTAILRIGGMHPLFLQAMGGLTYYASPNFSQKFSPLTLPAPLCSAKLLPPANASKENLTVEPAEIMEITLDNGQPGVLCCYQEDYHRRLDRPEGTWKRVIVHSTIPPIASSTTSTCYRPNY